MKKLLFVYFLFTSVIINGQSINWMKFEKAASLANSKIIMVYFYNEDCSWCKRLEETTFVDNRIIKALRKDFLSVKINPKKKGKVKIRNIEYSYKDLAMKAKINNYPAYAFFLFKRTAYNSCWWL